MSRNNDCIYDDNVNYDDLGKHTYSDAPGEVFYTCPRCGREYLATFIIEEEGRTMCIDCWNEVNKE